MSHYVEILQFPHLAEKGLQITSVSLLPVLSFIIRAEIRIGVLQIMNRRYDLVKILGGENILVQLAAVFIEADLYSLEYLEFLGRGPAECSFRNKVVHTVNLRLLGFHIEDLADYRLEFLLHLGDKVIAMIGEANATESFVHRGFDALLDCGRSPVKRKLAMVVCVEKHIHEYSVFLLILCL